MRARSLAALVAAVAVSVTLAACGATDTTAPINPAAATKTAADASNANLVTTLLGSPKNITPALRDTPLAKSITVSKQIGILGGTIAIPEAGLSIIVPPLAIPSTKTISITALAGDTLAYEFEPHGLKFGLPLVMTQSLAKTNAGGSLLGLLNLKVGYFPDSKHITSVTELLGVQVDLLNQTAITTLWHFSGYIIATGRDGDSF